MIDISMVSQLYPIFFVLTAVNVFGSYMSVRVIDEVYLNNQRSYILFNEFFKDKNVKNVEEINNQENFCLPNLMNSKNCKFIQYGHHSIYEVLAASKPHYYT